MFDQMLERNAVSWSSMISVYVHMGMFREALELFNDMQLCGFRPNHAGIVGALAAYLANRDQSADAIQLFARVQRRVGLLEEAKRLVRAMPMGPDSHCVGLELMPGSTAVSTLHLLVHSSTMGLSRYIHDKPVDAQAFRPRGASEALDH
ncbi:hypothetical protein V6N11_048655 [Hibiscus sabdariffa]|uniref:Pentatricopeptide repeat-containing protein n=1 Tax=Hibiscus sabdariffa TaxID=183260 RepID=A0ABR2PW04_9ROSI